MRPSPSGGRSHDPASRPSSRCVPSPACAAALGVQVGDIDFLARTLRVTRQLQRAKPADIETGKDLVEAAGGITVMVRPPKYEFERTIYLPDGEPIRWLFDEEGKPWNDNLVDYRWRSTRTKAGVTFKLHELRH